MLAEEVQNATPSVTIGAMQPVETSEARSRGSVIRVSKAKTKLTEFTMPVVIVF